MGFLLCVVFEGLCKALLALWLFQVGVLPANFRQALAKPTSDFEFISVVCH
jgi:hypothetical protein